MLNSLVVLGGGESGVGAALLGKREGYEVFVSDRGEISAAHRAELDAAGIEYEQGVHSVDRLLCARLVVKSPGIPDDSPLIRRMDYDHMEIISEIEFAGRYATSKFVGVTGSNGKTTTTLLTHHIMRQAGLDARLAGNVGVSLARQVALGPDKQPEWYVVELSSFQLDGMRDFHCNAAILCNITPDHLDRYHNDFNAYARSKASIARNMEPCDTLVYNADDPATLSHVEVRRSHAVCVSLGAEPNEKDPWLRVPVAHLDGDRIAINMGAGLTLPVADLPIAGRHNLYNAMQAMTVCLAIGLAPDQVAAGMRSFRNAPHRLEKVAESAGVLWVNDSKATNVDAAYFALEAQTRPVIWIVGGKDKGNDYQAIADLAKRKVKALVCLGADNAKPLDFFRPLLPAVVDTHDVDACVAACQRLAQPGDVVLLSPCCASFDLFNGYEQRGDLFKQAVAKAVSK